MNRLLSILVTLFILFLVYLWINHLTQDSDAQPATKETPVEVIPPVDDLPADDPADETAEQESPDESADEKSPPAEPAPLKQPDSSPKEKEVTQPKVTKPTSSTPPAPKEKTTQPQTRPASGSTDASGMHLVIAGNFLTRANAEERVKQLQKLGYANAEVVNFELSEYHTACAGRYSDLNEARKVSRKIKEMHNIDTYVRLGN